MAGLGSVNRTSGTYLSIAGGYVWNRKAGSDDPDYQVQKYDTNKKDSDGKVIQGERAGAQYSDFEGKVIGVEFKTHSEYGESVNVTFEANDENYIISISTNNRNSQDMMKALLKVDLDKDVYLKPYDFTDKEGKRAQGIVFRQDGEKITLRNDDAPSKDGDWFKNPTGDAKKKKAIRRYFEDLTEWFVAEIEEKICPKFKKEEASKPVKTEEVKEVVKEEVKKVVETKKEEVNEEVVPKLTPLKMRRALKEYVEENYEGKELPKLSKEELVVWYDLASNMEELPWKSEDTPEAEVPKSDLDTELDKLV